MHPEIQAIIDTAAGLHLVDPSDLLGAGRSRSVAAARADAMAELNYLGLSHREIGKHFNRDHSTVHWILKHYTKP
jgi:chromosomal replication initiation ATPase DnaA